MGSHIFRFLGQGSSSYLRLANVPEWTVALNICPSSPFEDLPFLLTTEDWLKLHSPHEKCGLTPEEYGFMPEEFREN